MSKISIDEYERENGLFCCKLCQVYAPSGNKCSLAGCKPKIPFSLYVSLLVLLISVCHGEIVLPAVVTINHHLRGRPHQMNLDKQRSASRSIYVRGYTKHTSKQDIREFFQVFGTINTIWMPETAVSYPLICTQLHLFL